MICCSVLQCVAVCCSVLQCVAVCCRAETGRRGSRGARIRWSRGTGKSGRKGESQGGRGEGGGVHNATQEVETWRILDSCYSSVLQCVTVCCNVLQCSAV